MSDNSSDKLKAVEKKVTSLQKKLSRENMFTLIVSLLLLAVITAYFVYGYLEIKSVLVPKTVVSLAARTVDDQLPQLRSSVTEEVNKNAPVWAEQLSQQAVDTVPSMREQLEEYTVKGVDQAIERSVSLTEDTFREFLQENRNEIERAIKELEENDKLSDESVAQIGAGLNERLNTNVQAQASEVLVTLDEVNSKLKYLAETEELSQLEQLEKEFLMILRRMHLREEARMLSSAG